MSTRPSPLPNRVTPFGEIVVHAARGDMFGNRGGRIHSDDYRIIRYQGSPRWICCVLDFKGRQRALMGSSYTELFFLDEATALAAGHRPCFECRRKDAMAFANAWAKARGLDQRAGADEMDIVLKADRRAERLTIGPDDIARGAMIASGKDAFLFDGERFHRWGFDGYAPGTPKGVLKLLTPASAHAALVAGYRPAIHASAGCAGSR